jgi:hypothetical protein
MSIAQLTISLGLRQYIAGCRLVKNAGLTCNGVRSYRPGCDFSMLETRCCRSQVKTRQEIVVNPRMETGDRVAVYRRLG